MDDIGFFSTSTRAAFSVIGSYGAGNYRQMLVEIRILVGTVSILR